MFALCRRALASERSGGIPGRSALIAASIALGVRVDHDLRLDDALDQSLRDATTPTALADLYVSNGDSGMARALTGRVAAVEGVLPRHGRS